MIVESFSRYLPRLPTTMMKGKKQEAEEGRTIPLSPQSLGLSDAQYGYLSKALAAGPLQRDGRMVVAMGYRSQRGLRGFRRTPLGMLAPTVWESLGVSNSLERVVLSTARPFCGKCNQYPSRVQDVDLSVLPETGYVALIVGGVAGDFSLQEQCELLGSERALVDGRVVRIEEVQKSGGEPVLGVFNAANHAEIRREIAQWFSVRGGGLRVVHLADRGAIARPIGRLSREWVCPGCEASFPDVSLEALEGAPSCGRCRGEGWLQVDEGRLLACEDCKGFGAVSPFTDYRCGSRTLATVAGATLLELHEVIKDQMPPVAENDLRLLNDMCEMGLGGYPLGMPESLLSAGERAYFVSALAQHGGDGAITVAFDVGAFGGEEKIQNERVREEKTPLVLFGPEWTPPKLRIEGATSEVKISLTDIARGPLCISKLEFPIGAATLIQGGCGVGKSLLLSELSRRFAKRRKNPAAGFFGALKTEVLIDSGMFVGDRMLSLVGLEGDFARAASSVRRAKEMGAVERDFVLSTSRYRCPECVGADGATLPSCDACGGSGFNSVLGQMELGGLTINRLMNAPLSESLKALWASDRFAEFGRLLPGELAGALRLGQPTQELSPVERRFLTVFGGLVGVMAQPKKIKDTLILLDNPFGVKAEHQQVLASIIRDLVHGGATVVCASVPAALENLFACVIRLGFVSKKGGDANRDRFFDSRCARTSVVV